MLAVSIEESRVRVVLGLPGFALRTRSWVFVFAIWMGSTQEKKMG